MQEKELKKNCIKISNLKAHFEIFKRKNYKAINDKILLSFSINPFDKVKLVLAFCQNCKIKKLSDIDRRYIKHNVLYIFIVFILYSLL